jgi:hypothetical protein
MTFKDFYSAVIETGIENDFRGKEEIVKLLAEERAGLKLDEKKKNFRPGWLFFSDTGYSRRWKLMLGKASSA